MTSIFYNKEPIVLNPELACLVGLNESIILQQFHYWIEKNKATATNYFDGRYWTYSTIQEYTDRDFRFWSADTVRRTINKLINLGYLIKGNYNKMKMDKTSWYSINYHVIDELARKMQAKQSSPPPMQNINMDGSLCQMQDSIMPSSGMTGYINPSWQNINTEDGKMPSSNMASCNLPFMQNANIEDGKISTSNMADCNVPFMQNINLEDGRLPNAIPENIKEIKHKSLDKDTNTQDPPAPAAPGESVKETAEAVTDAEVVELPELLFDEFWKLYPRKESKQQAKKAWMKLKPGQKLFNMIANALEYRSQTKEWLAEGGRYIPHPATWLNARRWEDEVDLQKLCQSAAMEEKYGGILINGKPLDPVQRKQMEYIEKQLNGRANAGEE